MPMSNNKQNFSTLSLKADFSCEQNLDIWQKIGQKAQKYLEKGVFFLFLVLAQIEEDLG